MKKRNNERNKWKKGEKKVKKGWKKGKMRNSEKKKGREGVWEREGEREWKG